METIRWKKEYARYVDIYHNVFMLMRIMMKNVTSVESCIYVQTHSFTIMNIAAAMSCRYVIICGEKNEKEIGRSAL